MSISRNEGGLASYFARLWASPLYNNVREGGKRVLSRLPGPAFEIARRTEEHMKGMVAPGTLFEELGFNYIGPIDGHNVRSVRRAIEDARQAGGPGLIHVITRKGLGYAPAEANPARFHGTGPFDVRTGEAAPDERKSFTSHFSDFMVHAGAADDRVVAITAAMADGTGLRAFSQRFPDRFFDVGIAEQHAVALAAGMALGGFRPVVSIYSTFLQRGYDQVVHDVAIQSLPVRFAIDRAGLVGADGPTHAGSFDLAYLGCLPNFVIMAAADEAEKIVSVGENSGHCFPCK